MFYFSICFISFFLLFIISGSLFFISLTFLMKNFVFFIEWELISFQSSSIVMTFLFDWMSLLFMSFVLFISALVILYSKDYMSHELNINRFILLVLLFVFSMMMLIISPNLISILLGWDGLGLVSYLLVIYFQNVKSFNAGMITALSNRIGDVALLMAIAWMLNYGSWNYIFYIEIMKNDTEMEIIAFLVVLAAMTKSAQIPFSSWLPAAMAAPTPVSALVHSSTLVTAGVYLLIRFNVLFVETIFGKILLLLGGLTMFMAGLGANFEFDLKKIIALSTLSQLGLMMSILAMGFPILAFFHLLTHALFKALLFMCAGAVIHNMKNSQDIRFMGALTLSMPFTTMCMNVANLALCGFPFLAGFYSKDLILEISSLSFINMFSYFLFFFSTGLTVMYSFRLVYYSLSGGMNSMGSMSVNDSISWMSRSMLILLMMAVIGGAMLSWLIFPSPDMICLSIFMKNLTLLVCLFGGLMGYFLSNVSLYFSNKSMKKYLFCFLNSTMWFLPFLSTTNLVKFPLELGNSVIKSFDQGWSEYFGGQNLYKLMAYLSKFMQFLQTNNLKIYLLTFVFWVIFLVCFMFL
uniref:NADH-ubiquinone oxidoreductase chain 5 n=1 Tax=Propsilocerus taihuensis TaxID=2789523 RepID=A0A8K1KT71_9DIPT|nr:NADH dehydrogenase subunit 5 [Propsilocerus taihuensis]UDE16198.1 NADH dehydrogenase subunit 5 [Propsilocerus taihuensis]